MQEVELRPHQRKAVGQLHNGSILCGGVGTGKSRVAMQYYVEKESPRDVYIITTAKKRDSLDWEAEALAHGVGTSADASFHGVVRVDSWNNLWKYIHIKDAFFIFDEQRLVGSGTWVRTFLKIVKANRWILLSATPGDTWLDYIPVFVANGMYPNRTSFLREHVVYNTYSKFPKVDRYIGVSRLVKNRNALLVHMPYERHTNRILTDVWVDHDEELYKKVVKKRWHVFENRPLRDVSELFSVMRKVVNSDRSRLDSIHMLMEEHPKLIVFYNFDYELELLRTLNETEGESCQSSSTKSASAIHRPNQASSSTETTSITSTTRQSNSLEPSSSMSGRETILSSESERTGLGGPSTEDGEWAWTIWDENWSPEPGQKDPRLSVENQKARANFQKANHLPRVLTQERTEGWTSSSTSTKESSHKSKSASSNISKRSLPQRESRSKLVPLEDSSGSDPTSHFPKTPSCSTTETCSDCGKSGIDCLAARTAESPSTESLSSCLPKTSSRPTDGSLIASELTSDPSSNAEKTEASSQFQNSDVMGVSVAEWNGHKHEPIPKTDRWVYLVQYTAGAEGWNCTETDTVVFYSLNYSYRVFEQCQGRIDRLDTRFTDLHYYIFRSKAAIDAMIWKALKTKQKFNEPKNYAALQSFLRKSAEASKNADESDT